MQCRPGCGACCIAPSISSSIPGMPNGKQAGERCIHLSAEHLCLIFNSPDRPRVCTAFQAVDDMCGNSFQEALANLMLLEKQTGN